MSRSPWRVMAVTSSSPATSASRRVAASGPARAPAGWTQGGVGALRRLAASAPGGRAVKAARFLSVAERGMPDAYRAWISYVQDEDVDRLVPGGSRWGREDYSQRWE